MRILVLGSGAREHALCAALAQSASATDVFCVPGNPGIAGVATCLPGNPNDPAAMIAFARAHAIDLTVVGPEAPLAAGIADAFAEANLALFGPTRAAAQLETSKIFAKDFFAAHHIPTARFITCETRESALHALSNFSLPCVIKQDGLAGGKGVVIAQTRIDAQAAIAALAPPFVIEAFLDGEEVSVIAIANGTEYLLCPTAQDHKRIGVGDTGPNTGGMGAYSPVPWWPGINGELESRVRREIIEPTLQGLARAGTPFRGFLYAGLMIVNRRDPHLLEYNVRFGDPEAQAILPRARGDFAKLLYEASCGESLNASLITWDPRPTLCVVMSAAGYPGPPRVGDTITGLDAAQKIPDTKIFHAATARDAHGAWRTNGGRVLSIVGTGDTLQHAKDAAYRAVAKINWDGCHVRSDIGWRALMR